MSDLLRLEPGIGALTANLFLPKELVVEEAVRAQLTFGDGDDKITLVRNHPHHLEVPRNAFSLAQMAELEIPVRDLRPKTYAPVALTPSSGFSLRTEQRPAIDTLVRHGGDATLNLATGRGKTVMAWFRAAQIGGPVLFVAPQKAHLANALKELKEFFDFQGSVGWMAGGKFEWECDVVVSTVQMLARFAQEGRLPPEFYRRFALAIYDEAHHMSAAFFSRAADVCQGTRLALTATARRRDEKQGVFFAHLGPIVYSDVEPDMVPIVHIMPLDTEFTPDEYAECLDCTGNEHLGMMYKVLGGLTARNNRICAALQADLDAGRVIYALTHSPDHAQALHARFPTAGIILENMGHEERLRQLNLAQLTITTYGIGAESYNRKDLDCVHHCTPPGARDGVAIQFDQGSGRGLRLPEGKPTPLVRVWWDRTVPILNGLVWGLIHHSRGRGWEVQGVTSGRTKRRLTI